uniref:adenylyltransferase and sulfurtransferase MOCS3 isoform X3 n=1 Tax=Myxine glutinosa TaxID=7769 RepID=UPI00358EDBE4
MAAPEDCSVLQAALVEREREIAKLKSQINNLKGRGSCDQLLDQGVPVFDEREVAALPRKTTLSRDQIGRYSRQLVLPELGVQGQLRLANTAVLVVGCGGLGSPLAQYVAAAGIGRLGLVDHDAVEVNNLHRQVLHSERRLGWSKARSAAHTVQQLNSDVDCIPYHLELCASNAVELIKQYNIVADCSDNVPTRYLVSDACVLAQVPLVSASALRMEGQLTVYCCKGGPCYRCINPEPPSPDTVTNCADGGVFGVVPGVMGSLQALEVLKIAAGMNSSYSERLLLFDGLSGRFRTVRIRGRQKHCIACGDSSLIPPLPDYESWCGTTANDKCRHLMLLNKEERIEVQEYKELLEKGNPHLLLDVRPAVEFEICSISRAIHLPLEHIQTGNHQAVEDLRELVLQEISKLPSNNASLPVFVICKQGNDSQKAVLLLREFLAGEAVTLMDIQGGLMAWAARVDLMFPQY